MERKHYTPCGWIWEMAGRNCVAWSGRQGPGYRGKLSAVRPGAGRIAAAPGWPRGYVSNLRPQLLMIMQIIKHCFGAPARMQDAHRYRRQWSVRNPHRLIWDIQSRTKRGPGRRKGGNASPAYLCTWR